MPTVDEDFEWGRGKRLTQYMVRELLYRALGADRFSSTRQHPRKSLEQACAELRGLFVHDSGMIWAMSIEIGQQIDLLFGCDEDHGATADSS